ncbi:MAG TPA: sugar kinase [Candidatus Limnocylindrales bacterium]
MAEVVTLGECLIALVASATGPLTEATTFERHVAGAEANVAVGLARLGHSVEYAGRVGADGFGTTILRKLRGEGVGVSALRVDPTASTGIMVRERRALGPAQVLYYRAGSAGSMLALEDVDGAAPLFEGARWLHVTGITPALSASARAAVERAAEHARAAGMTVSLDLNFRRRLWSEADAAPVFRTLAASADVVFGDADEAVVALGLPADTPAEKLARGLVGLGAATAVIKTGADGAVAATRDGIVVRSPALPVRQVVDPVGAGDAFAAGFIAATLEGQHLETAMRTGNACGAAALSALGDMTGLPDRAELDRLLAAPSLDTLR